MANISFWRASRITWRSSETVPRARHALKRSDGQGVAMRGFPACRCTPHAALQAKQTRDRQVRIAAESVPETVIAAICLLETRSVVVAARRGHLANRAPPWRPRHHGRAAGRVDGWASFMLSPLRRAFGRRLLQRRTPRPTSGQARPRGRSCRASSTTCMAGSEGNPPASPPKSPDDRAA
jgi:hypothetical protein